MGAGKRLKAVNNLLNTANAVLLAEAVNLIRRLGLDEETAYQVIKSCSGQSCSFDARFGRIAAANFEGGFKLELMIKDLRIALSEAQGLPMPMSSLALQLYNMAAPDAAGLDFSAVSRLLAEK